MPATQSRLTRPPRQARAASDAVPYPVQVAAAWGWRIALLAVVVWGLGQVVAFFSQLAIAMLISLLLAALLVPAVDFLDRHGWPRVLATLSMMLLGIAGIVGLFTLVVTQIVTGFGDLADSATEGIEQLQAWLESGALGLSTAQLSGLLSQALEALQSNSQQLVTSAVAVGNTAAGLVTGLFFVLFITIFITWDGRRVWSWLVRLLPAPAEGPFDAAMHRGWVTLTSYVRATIIVAMVDAVGIGLGAFFLGVPLAVPLGVLVFLGAFVPIVGAVLTGAVAVLVGLVAQGPLIALAMLGVVLAVQQLESNVLQAVLLGKAVAVHPLAVFVAISAGGAVAGLVGILFAVPLIAVTNTVVSYLVRGDAALPEAIVEHVTARDDDDPERETTDGQRRREDEESAQEAREAGADLPTGPLDGQR